MYQKLSLLLFFLALTSCADGKDQNQVYKTHSFQAVVKKVRLQSELLKQGKKNTDTVSVKVPAILFDQPIRIADVRNIDESFGLEIDFFIAYIKANIRGSKSDILSYEPHWLDSHWAEIRMPSGVVELIMLFPSCLQESTL